VRAPPVRQERVRVSAQLIEPGAYAELRQRRLKLGDPHDRNARESQSSGRLSDLTLREYRTI
jgi:hypothetical protein